MLELRDYIRIQRGLPLLRVSNEALYERLMSMKSALRSILPHTKDPMGDTVSNAIPSMRMRVHISDLHRHILCALGNNLAGLGNISGEQLYHLLRIVSDKHIIVKLLSEGGYLRLPIAQQLLRACIEVGNAPMVDMILSMSVLQIRINELTCEVDWQPYTALERAWMLRNKAMIEVMLRHGADVHKTYNRYTGWEIGSGGALECALLGSTGDGRLDPQICNKLLEKTNLVNNQTFQFLMYKEKHEVLINVLQKLARANHHGLQVAHGTEWLWEQFLRGIEQEDMAMEILDIMESLDVAKTTRMLNIAASNGHQTVVLRLLHGNLGLNEDSLCSAIRGESEELVRLFLKKGATVNDHIAVCGSEDVEDPYSQAIRTENERIIEILVEHHALERLDQCDSWVRAWKAAVIVCNKEVLAMLLSKRQHIPARHLGWALSSISKLGDYDMATELLKRGADVEAKSDQSSYWAERPLIEALVMNNSDIASLLLESGANPNGSSSEYSAIACAVRHGNHAMVEKLLAAGALLNPSNSIESSAFLEAVKKEDFEMMERLWYAGARARGALEIATTEDSVDACNWLLSHGADPHDSRALRNAYQHKSSLFGILLNAYKVRYPLGAGGFGSAVLWNALKSQDRHAVKLLLEHGADPNGFVYIDDEIDDESDEETHESFTPFFLAVTFDAGNDTSLAEFFLDCGHKPKAFQCTPQTVVAKLPVSWKNRRRPGAVITALLAAIGARNLPMVRLLSRRGDADVNTPASSRVKRTPLQRSAEVGSLDLVEFFYGSGADVNAQPAKVGGATALQLAAQGGFTAIVIYLLSKGALVDVPGAIVDGMTALECAAAHGRADVLYCLLRANAGQGGRDHKQFQRAFTYAKKAAHLSIVDMLREHLQSTGQYELFLEYKDLSATTEEVVT